MYFRRQSSRPGVTDGSEWRHFGGHRRGFYANTGWPMMHSTPTRPVVRFHPDGQWKHYDRGGKFLDFLARTEQQFLVQFRR